jgi:membrane protease YdiL (CAAX protease family)
VFGQFTFIVVAESVIVAIIIWYITSRRSGVRALGFHRKPILKDAAYVLVAFGLYFVAVAIATTIAKLVFHVDLDQKQELGFDIVITNRDKIVTFMSLVVIPPIVEEFLFRGFLFGGLRSKLPFIWAAVVTSALFASLHLAQGAGSVLWVAGIDTFILSLFLCYLREKTGNLWAGIFLHACKNMVAFLYLYIFAK